MPPKDVRRLIISTLREKRWFYLNSHKNFRATINSRQNSRISREISLMHVNFNFKQNSRRLAIKSRR